MRAGAVVNVPVVADDVVRGDGEVVELVDEVVRLVVQIAQEVLADLPALNVVPTKILPHLLQNLRDGAGVGLRYEHDQLPVQPRDQAMCLCGIFSTK